MSGNFFSRIFSDGFDERQNSEAQISSTDEVQVDTLQGICSTAENALPHRTLYWSNHNNSKHEFLIKSFRRLLAKNKRLNDYYKKLFEDEEAQIEQFLSDFFPENIPLSYFVANLSIKDQSEKRINLAIRLHDHGSFAEYLPSNSTISIRGYWPVQARNPVFKPEDIFTTYNDESAANYEIELQASASSLPPERSTNDNILTRELAQKLPPISAKTAERLKEWLEFLSFKRELVKEKTLGLRYIRYDLNKAEQLEFLVVGESKEELLPANQIFRRKDLEAYGLDVSTDKWRFTISDKHLSRRMPKGAALGQLKGQLDLLDANDTKHFSELLTDLYEQGLDNPVLGKVTIELPEDWKNKFDNALRDDEVDASLDEEGTQRYLNVQEELLESVPKVGFISFPSVGDLALIKRHEQTIKNLRQNEGCYSPYLSSYLFDINQAGRQVEAPEIESWFNDELNDAQKMAVAKMMGAPDLCLVQGPPGTGKTTVIAEAILQLARQGETVLLASQSHDAIDNALSCIRNHPELRAIRLAKGQGKITEEGKAFSEHRSLERYYSSLHTHVQSTWIEPQLAKKKEIDSLQKWVEHADFVSADISKAAKAYANALREEKSCREHLKQAKKSQHESIECYDNLQRLINGTKHNINFLLKGEGGLTSSAYFSQGINSLVQNLLKLSEINIELPDFCHNYELTTNPESLALILNKLLPIWRGVHLHIDQMRHDILRLQDAGNGCLQDEQTQVRLKHLEAEEKRLSDIMEEDESPVLASQWRTTRKEIKGLKQQQTGLDERIYSCFSDKTIFVNVANASEVEQILTARLKQLDHISNTIHQSVDAVVQDQENWVQDNSSVELPEDGEVKQAEASLARSESELRKEQSRLQKSKNEASKLLQQHGFSESDDFEQQLSKVKEDVENKSFELLEESKSRAPWEGFFSDWSHNLSVQNAAQTDWEHIERTFVENCNLIAISCNESDRTLKDAGVESFDTVIIDEVSKATPVELLMPLMRARRAVLVGDHRQLPPVFQESQDAQAFTDKAEEAQEDGDSKILTKDNLRRFENMVTASLFKEHFENADPSIRERLTVQYRMHPQIMGLVNNFYEGQLECGNPEKLREHNLHIEGKNNLLVAENDHVLWIDTSFDLKGQPYREDAERTNRLEAALIADTLVKINEQSRNRGFNQKNKQKVGVVSFYASQCRVIREEIRKVNDSKIHFDAIHVEINTVIRYQGKEKPIILISLVRNDGGPKNKRRSARANVARYEFINVAMSRAQNLLIVFGARNMLEQRDVFLPNMDAPGKKKEQVYRKIFGALDRSASIFPASEMKVREPVQNRKGKRGRK